MRITVCALSVVLTVVMAMSAWAGHVYDESETPSLLFVQSAASGQFDGKTLTLTGVPATIYFSDRPYRVYGQIANAKFAKLFAEKLPKSFEADPPNAALAVLGKGEQPVVVELMGAPQVKGESLSYPVRVLSGKMPEKIAPCALFIDAFPTAVNSQITD